MAQRRSLTAPTGIGFGGGDLPPSRPALGQPASPLQGPEPTRPQIAGGPTRPSPPPPPPAPAVGEPSTGPLGPSRPPATMAPTRRQPMAPPSLAPAPSVSPPSGSGNVRPASSIAAASPVSAADASILGPQRPGGGSGITGGGLGLSGLGTDPAGGGIPEDLLRQIAQSLGQRRTGVL